MFMNLKDKFCLHLGFLDELNLVKIFATTDDWSKRLVVMGGVRGKEDLTELLREANIDYYTVGGDFPRSLPLAFEAVPAKIVDALDVCFRMVDETQLKIIRGEQTTPEELATRRPTALRVFSSTSPVSFGLERVAKWFKNQVEPGALSHSQTA